MNKLRPLIHVLILAVVLAGCATAQPVVIQTAAPTQDLNVIRTEAAQTVVAAITAEALANPSATPTLPPTETATPLPPPTLIATATPVPALPTATLRPITGGGSSIPLPTATLYTDRAELVTQSLKDGIVLTPSQDFDVKWTFKNTGLRAWNTEFYYRFAGGTLESSDHDIYFLRGPVAKNDTVDLIVDFVAPAASGRYTSNWELINDDGTAFARFNITIVIP